MTKKIIVIVISILISAMAFGMIASSFSIGNIGSSNDKADSTVDNTVDVLNYEIVTYMLSARDADVVQNPVMTLGDGGTQDWCPVVAPVECKGYEFDIGEFDYFDFEETGIDKYTCDLSSYCGDDLKYGQFYSVCVKSYDSNEVDADISLDTDNGGCLLGEHKTIYENPQTGKRCVYVTYFVYAINELKVVVNTSECEVVCYVTPFELFETGYVATMCVGWTKSGDTLTLENAPAGKYFSCNGTGDVLMATVDGLTDSVSNFECWSENTVDMIMFETYAYGILDIENATYLFSIFNAIYEPLTLPEGMSGEKVLEYTFVCGGWYTQTFVEYKVTSGNYVFVLPDLYEDAELYIYLDGELYAQKDCASGSHLITVSDDDNEHVLKIGFEPKELESGDHNYSRFTMSKGRFALFNVH